MVELSEPTEKSSLTVVLEVREQSWRIREVAIRQHKLERCSTMDHGVLIGLSFYQHGLPFRNCTI